MLKKINNSKKIGQRLNKFSIKKQKFQRKKNKNKQNLKTLMFLFQVKLKN